MIELGVITVLIALLGWEKYQNRKERAKMLNLIVAKDVPEAVNLEIADRTKIDVKEDHEPDLIPESQMDDREFNRRIKEQLDG
jgi:hypothetical protein